jgi:hypothetical protein
VEFALLITPINAKFASQVLSKVPQMYVIHLFAFSDKNLTEINALVQMVLIWQIPMLAQDAQNIV